MLVLRHASAGERLSQAAADRARGLDRAGLTDARELPAVFSAFTIERIVTSPLVRCVETVAPLALRRQLFLEQSEALLPDATLRHTLALLDELPPTALVCTHRETIDRLFRGRVTCEKGGAWLAERNGGGWVPVEYLPPPVPVTADRRKAALV